MTNSSAPEKRRACLALIRRPMPVDDAWEASSHIPADTDAGGMGDRSDAAVAERLGLRSSRQATLPLVKVREYRLELDCQHGPQCRHGSGSWPGRTVRPPAGSRPWTLTACWCSRTPRSRAPLRPGEHPHRQGRPPCLRTPADGSRRSSTAVLSTTALRHRKMVASLMA